MALLREKYGKETFQQVYGQIKESKIFAQSHKKLLTKAFGNRFKKAYKTVMDGKVKKYIFYPSMRVVWITIGREREYRILQLANFCPCDDFYFRVISHEAYMCYHLLAQKLAELLNKYEIVEKQDEVYNTLINRWRIIPFKLRVLSSEETENIRRISYGVLSEEMDLLIGELLGEIYKVGFTSLTSRHLSSILVADKKRRFRCLKGRWSLNRNIDKR